jgi:hypothetical protein
MSGMPLEWLDAGSWRLPSGKALAEFALQAGFLVPMLFRSETLSPEEPLVEGAARLDADAQQVKGVEKGNSR